MRLARIRQRPLGGAEALSFSCMITRVAEERATISLAIECCGYSGIL